MPVVRVIQEKYEKKIRRTASSSPYKKLLLRFKQLSSGPFCAFSFPSLLSISFFLLQCGGGRGGEKSGHCFFFLFPLPFSRKRNKMKYKKKCTEGERNKWREKGSSSSSKSDKRKKKPPYPSGRVALHTKGCGREPEFFLCTLPFVPSFDLCSCGFGGTAAR